MASSRLRKFFVNTKDVRRSGFLWNVVSSGIFSCQSAIMLILITRTCGIDDAGIFSISYSVASMMSYIGEYSVRKYQVSDIHEACRFSDYFTFRVITCTLMMLVSVIYSVYGLRSLGYSREKFIIMILIAGDLMVYAFQELYYGRLQQLGRLDIGSKITAFRTIVGMVFYAAALVLSGDLLISTVVWLAATAAGFLISTWLVLPECRTKGAPFRWRNIRKIGIDCFPLFLGMFLLMYIGNAPRYAIDAYMNDASQAKYSFIFMPVFVIGLMSNFIFNPVLLDLANDWESRQYGAFMKIVWKNVLVIVGLTFLAIAVALTIGCPVLGWLYSTDLADVKAELCILMIGGGMLAMVNFITVLATIIRVQQYLIGGYLAVALAALLCSGRFVQRYEMMGAAVLYTALLTALALVFAVVLGICIIKKKRAL